MSFSMILALLVAIVPLPLHASETGTGTLPPELIKLRDEGQLTVRALWAWGLVPEPTAAMAMDLKGLGLDLISADGAQLASWLALADAGQLGLNDAQRGFLLQLISRMSEVGRASEVVASAPASSGKLNPGFVDPAMGMPTSPDAVLSELGNQADGGDPRAKVILALALGAGFNGTPDPVGSIELLSEAAAAGDADAMALLADEYESGLWVVRDEAKAMQLRRKAAEAGSQLARWALQ